MARTVFFISDGTGITAETLGHSLLTQFDVNEFTQVRLPFIDTLEKVDDIMTQIEETAARDGQRPLVFHTLVQSEFCERMAGANACVMDFFGTMLSPLEAELGRGRSPKVGRAHGMQNLRSYEHRMEATNYAMQHDDGQDTRYQNADLILIGVSRSGKTPTCLYMALQHGVQAANYPLTEDDITQTQLPAVLSKHREKLYALTIEADRLSQIRNARRPDSRYSSMRQCQREVNDAEALYHTYRIPYVNTTHTSIEEICSKVLADLGVERRMY